MIIINQLRHIGKMVKKKIINNFRNIDNEKAKQLKITFKPYKGKKL